MNVHVEAVAAPVTLRPSQALFRESLFALGLGSTLVFVVLYWITIPDGDWDLVAAVHVGLVVLAFVIARQFFDTGITLTADGLDERGFNGGTSRVARGDVHAVLIIDIYEQLSADTLPHLFVSDAAGRLLLRMRGQYWPEGDMDRVATHLGVRMTRVPHPVSKAEFYVTSPQLLYWFERFAFQGRRARRRWASRLHLPATRYGESKGS
jgi:hypothetical protein